MIKQYLYGHVSEDTAYIVNDYPYGFRLRTQIRYWVESNKNGDRFCSQTLNPKTGVWNKAKKSTYDEVDLMGLNELGHVTYKTISHWDDEEKMDTVLAGVDLSKLNDNQLNQIKTLRAIFRTRKHISFEVVNITGWNEEEKEKHDLEQKEASKRINKAFQYEYSKLD